MYDLSWVHVMGVFVHGGPKSNGSAVVGHPLHPTHALHGVKPSIAKDQMYQAIQQARLELGTAADWPCASHRPLLTPAHLPPSQL